jgi:uncharacterized small protein (DUF1192 family)
MKVERNIDGIRQSAQKKSQEAFEKVEKGIQQLVKDKQTINFNTVARAAGVSKAWLYKQREVKSRIEHLRDQCAQKGKIPKTVSASDKSKDSMLEKLKGRIKDLEADNRDLRRQNEVAYGQVLRVQELEKRIQQLETENKRLKNQSASAGGVDTEVNGSTPVRDVMATLEKLGVRMNSTLQRSIENAPEGITSASIKSLQESMAKTDVRNPAGFLYKAISDAWQPGRAFSTTTEMAEFNTWWAWAYSKGLVKASTQVDGIMRVLTAEDEWIPFETAAKKFAAQG